MTKSQGGSAPMIIMQSRARRRIVLSMVLFRRGALVQLFDELGDDIRPGIVRADAGRGASERGSAGASEKFRDAGARGRNESGFPRTRRTPIRGPGARSPGCVGRDDDDRVSARRRVIAETSSVPLPSGRTELVKMRSIGSVSAAAAWSARRRKRRRILVSRRKCRISAAAAHRARRAERAAKRPGRHAFLAGRFRSRRRATYLRASIGLSKRDAEARGDPAAVLAPGRKRAEDADLAFCGWGGAMLCIARARGGSSQERESDMSERCSGRPGGSMSCEPPG